MSTVQACGEVPIRFASMRLVAERAGVSLMTVSRVVNTPELVRPSTRARVLSVIAELGWTPDPDAQALARRRRGPRTGRPGGAA